LWRQACAWLKLVDDDSFHCQFGIVVMLDLLNIFEHRIQRAARKKSSQSNGSDTFDRDQRRTVKKFRAGRIDVYPRHSHQDLERIA